MPGPTRLGTTRLCGPLNGGVESLLADKPLPNWLICARHRRTSGGGEQSNNRRVPHHHRRDELAIFDTASFIQASAKVFSLVTSSIRHERVVLDRCPGTCLRAPAAEVACLGGLCGAGGGCAAEVSGSQSKVRWADSNGEPTWQWSLVPSSVVNIRNALGQVSVVQGPGLPFDPSWLI